MIRMSAAASNSSKSATLFFEEPKHVTEQSTFEQISFTCESKRGRDTVYLHEFWSYLASTLRGDDIRADFRAGVWVGLMQDHFEKPELRVPLLAVFVGDAEWLPQQSQLATRNNSQWMPLTMDDADAGTDGYEKTMDPKRCTTIDGVYVQPRVSYLALFRSENGRPVRRAEQYILPGLLTTTAYAGAEHNIALLYACLRID